MIFFNVSMLGLLGHLGRKSGALHMDEQADEESPNCILPQGEILFIRDLVHLYLKLVSIKASCANGGLKMHPLRICENLLVRDSVCFLCLMKEKMSDPIYPEPNIGTLFILQINTIFSLKNSVSVSKVFPKTFGFLLL